MTATEVEVQVSPAPSIDVDVQFGDEPQIDVEVQIEPPTFTVMSVLPTGPRGPAGPPGADGMGAVDSVNGETGVVVLSAADIPFTPDGSIAATDVQAAIVEVRDEAGTSGAPDDATYLTTTAHAGLSAEVVVGATPGGELGGTWAAPTVDTVHSGSSHAQTQAAAEATAAAALSAHTAASDPHPGYLTPAEGDAAYDALGAASTVNTALTNHLNDSADAHDASAISFVPNGSISSTDVQAAIEEVRDEAGSGSLTDAVILEPTGSARNVIEGVGDVTELTLKADTGQTVSLLVALDEDGNVVWAMNPTTGATPDLRGGFPFTVAEVTQEYEGNPVTYKMLVFAEDDFVPLAWSLEGDANPRVCFTNNPENGVLFLGDGTFEPYTDLLGASIGWESIDGHGRVRLGPLARVDSDFYISRDLYLEGRVVLADLAALPESVVLRTPAILDDVNHVETSRIHRTDDDPNQLQAEDALFFLSWGLATPLSGTIRIALNDETDTQVAACDDIDVATIDTASIQAAFDSGIGAGLFTVTEPGPGNNWQIVATGAPWTGRYLKAVFLTNTAVPAPSLSQTVLGRALGLAGTIGDFTIGTAGPYTKIGSADTDWSPLLQGGLTSEPADASLDNSQFVAWLDDTPGATELQVKAKDSAGTVRTATIPLS